MTEHAAFNDMLARAAELSVPEQAALREHLDTCPECRQRASAYAQQDEALREVVAGARRFTVADRVLHQIERSGERRRSRRSLSVWTFATAAAVFALVVLGGAGIAHLLLTRHGSPPSTTATNLSVCEEPGEGWHVTGPCRYIASPDAFRAPGTVFYTLSVRWTRVNLHHPRYVVRTSEGFPITFSANATNVLYSQLAVNPVTHEALYAIGRAGRQP